MTDRRTVQDVLATHKAAGAFFTAGGLTSFVREEGHGEPVVLMHGLPASCFLYRKVLPELASRGYRGIAFDLPGLGLAERPTDFDYSIPGLGAFAAAAVDALEIGSFHLVVHDAGGPVGFELAALLPERVRSLTILNTMVALPSGPFPGEVLARVSRRVGGPAASQALWRQMMYRVGIANHAAVPPAEVDAYRLLALGDDGGSGYLRIMSKVRDGHDPNRYRAVVNTRTAQYPVTLVWGAKDPILSLRRFGWDVLAATGLPSLTALPAKHFLQEDQAPAIAELIATNARNA